jgi:hypothetical protein
MEFRVIIEIDRAARPAFAARTAEFARGRDKETRFWDSFRAAKTRDGGRKPEAVPSPPSLDPSVEKPEALATSVADIHVQLRTRLPGLIHSELVERLALRLGTTPETVNSRRADVSDSPAVPDDKAAALAALRIEIGGIRGGSLELLVIAFGFAKLATLAGITGAEFAEYLKIVTPVALNLLYGTNVPLVGSAKAADGKDAPGPTKEDMAAAASPSLLSQGSPYIVAAVLTCVALWLLINAFDAESSRVAAERNAILATVGQQGTVLAGERTALAQKLGELAGTLLHVAAQHDAELESANRDLSARQMALIARLDAAGADRDRAVIDFVKARLFPAPASGPGPQTPPCTALTGDTARALQQVLQAQRLYPYKIDGDFGQHSQDALIRFQRGAGLPATGLPDQPTMTRLGLSCETLGR